MRMFSMHFVEGQLRGALDIEVIKFVFELQVANGQLRGCVRAAGGGRAVARACAVMCSHLQLFVGALEFCVSNVKFQAQTSCVL